MSYTRKTGRISTNNRNPKLEIIGDASFFDEGLFPYESYSGQFELDKRIELMHKYMQDIELIPLTDLNHDQFIEGLKRLINGISNVSGASSQDLDSDLLFYVDQFLNVKDKTEFQYSNKSKLLLPKSTIICKEQYSDIIAEIAKRPEFMKELDPHKFEEIIGELLYKMGYQVELTKKTRDGGYDILAIDHTPLGPYRIAVECKRWTEDKIGIDVVRALYGVKMMRHFNQAMIVTTSTFSNDVYMEVELLASEILLKDEYDVWKWCRDNNSLKF